jgi:hypothetical protein
VPVVVALYVFTDNPLGAWLFFALGVLELVIATVAWRGGSPLALDPPAAYGWDHRDAHAESHA